MTNELTTTDFQALDKLDETQIIAELQGAVEQDMVYSFRADGKQVTGLSWSGIKHLAAKLGNVQVDLLEMIDTGETWVVAVKASIGDSSRLGAYEQKKNFVKRDGTVMADGFALPKATSKAQRNAIRALLPEKLIVETVKAHAALQRPPANGNGTRPNGNGTKEPSKPALDLYSKVKEAFDLTPAEFTNLVKECGWDKVTAKNSDTIFSQIEKLQQVTDEDLDF